ncbi:MAG: pepsin/retropepsin-like aspartic protease family protein [Bradyrhizobium sp.]
MNLIFPAPIERRFVILLCLAATSFWAGHAAARSPISLEALRRDGYGSVDLMNDGRNRLYVPAEINGKKIRLLLDTGWGSSGISVGIDPSELHIVPEKGVQTTITANGVRVAEGHGMARSVVIGNVRIENTQISFGQFSDFGFIGHAFLKKCGAIIDLTNLRLYLRPPGAGRRVNLSPALTAIGLAEVPFFNSPHGGFVLNVEVNGVPTQMALDTGAQISVLDIRFAKEASAKGWHRRHVYTVDAAGVWSPADFAGTKTFKIEGIPIRTPTVFLARFAGYDSSRGKIVGVLGLDVIGLNWGIIDFAQQKFYFARAK